MLVTRGKIYTCSTCDCELVAVKNQKNCPQNDCALSCCGKLMQEAS